MSVANPNRFGRTHHGTRSTTCLLTLAILASACTGDILGTSGALGPSGGAGSTVGGMGPASVQASWPVSLDGHASALRRLSRDELLNAMQSLTGQSVARADLPEEQRRGHHPLRTSGMAFISTELGKLFPVVKGFAGKVAPLMLTQAACSQTGPAQRDCLVGWMQNFSERVLRRPPRSQEAQRFRDILSVADGSSDADRAAMEAALTAVFFAPSFLYRTELGAPIAGSPGKRALDGQELASKLSFFSSLQPPDAELLDAARTGRLADGAERTKQFDRLLQTPAGQRALGVFVLEWLGANESKVSQKSAAYLKGLSAGFASEIRAGADSFIASVLAGPEPTVGHLLTGTEFLADPALQQISKASSASGVATGDQADFERIGLLMHPQVIASHSKENGASPFQLGFFLKEALLCEKVAPPPAGAAAMAKKDAPAGLSMRESLEYRVSASPVCNGCHAQFAPLGFSFIAFDPLGRWVDKDPSSKPWDLSGKVATAMGDELAFQTPADLARDAAARPQVQGCFAQTALEWSLGRGLVGADATAVAELDQLVQKSGGNVPAIMRSIVGSPEFLNVVAAE